MKLSARFVPQVFVLTTILFGIHFEVAAHAEAEKNRYVADIGIDSGRCDNALRPCKTILYAAQNANKGDRILVASGDYQISEPSEIFYITSSLVPVLGGYNRFDHFQNQAPELNKTTLFGVPNDYVAQVQQQGFQVVRDGKSFNTAKIRKMKTQISQLNNSQSELTCTNGLAGSFSCNNVDLVAHMPLTAFSSGPSAANDIWGHIDLNTGKEYALIGIATGTAIVDLSDPASPVEVAMIRGTWTRWRDVKVHQYFETAENRWKAFAYVTADNANDQTIIIDLTDLPESASVVTQSGPSSSHNVHISGVDYSLGIRTTDKLPTLQLLGSFGGSGELLSYQLDELDSPTLGTVAHRAEGYSHDSATIVVDGDQKLTGCDTDQTSCSVIIDFNEREFLIWDHTTDDELNLISTTRYDDISQANMYVHSGWVTEDNQFLFVHDEFDEVRGGLDTTVRIFDISDLSNPTLAGTWRGETAAIDHNGFVRGNRYYMSNYERGLTVLDISDPSEPTEIGFFDTFPTSNSANYAGAWGVYPYLPSGLILVSDINSGLYILRDKTLDADAGSYSLLAATYNENTHSVVVELNRTAGDTASSVAIETIPGSAQPGGDYTSLRRTVNFSPGQITTSLIELDTFEAESEEYDEHFYVRLYNPTNGATLSSPSYLKVDIPGKKASAGIITFKDRDISILETQTDVAISVSRVGGTEGDISVSYQLANTADGETSSDFTFADGVLTWRDGEDEDKTIFLTQIDDQESETVETYRLSLTSDSAAIGIKNEINISIYDDESNLAPVVSLPDNFEVNTRQLTTITANANDDLDTEFTYSWSQTDGNPVFAANYLSGIQSDRIAFTAPATADNVTFKVTVTDQFGATGEATVIITIVEPNVADTSSSSSSSFGGLTFILLCLFTIMRRSGQNRLRPS